MSRQAFDFGDWRGEVARELAPGLAGPALEAEVRRIVDPAAAERTVHWGRNYLYQVRLRVGAAPLPAVVKQFRNLGWRARLRRALGGSRAERSWRNAWALRERGLGTPSPLLWIESARADGPSFYVSRALEDALELRYFLRALNAGEAAAKYPELDPQAVVAALGELARRLHRADVWFRDFTGGNVLLRRTASGLELDLVDLNRARIGRPPTASERLRDLARLPVLRRADQRVFLAAYFAEAPENHRAALRVYRFYHAAFLLKNRWKSALRGALGRGLGWLRPRRPHVHIPPPEAGAGGRDRIVWDALSDQPHQHASRLARARLRLADLPAHAAASALALVALPEVARRYRRLRRELYSEPIAWPRAGVGVRPWPAAPERLLGELEALGLRRVLLRLHPWEDDHRAEEALARELHRRGVELVFALPQNRALVRDPAHWRAKVEELAERFAPFGREFQVGQAINRSKWGIWTLKEWGDLAAAACEILHRRGLQAAGPAVIDFEYHQTLSALRLRRPGLAFDAVSALLYVDRRGAPENPQLGFDTVGKVALLRAIAESARRPTSRVWVSEVNWPLWEGPHSPAGRTVAVDEETQASHLVRYYLLAFATGLVERIYWWQLVAKGYGLIDPTDSGLRRRPAFAALATLERQLAGATFLGPLPAAPGAWLYRFRGAAGRPLMVGWSRVPGTRQRLPGAVTRATGRDGAALSLSGCEVELGPAPVYLELEG
ncbi:MAG: lipopolysaccharide kinase InaA family protein [Acidobacteriota bacterium]